MMKNKSLNANFKYELKDTKYTRHHILENISYFLDDITHLEPTLTRIIHHEPI